MVRKAKAEGFLAVRSAGSHGVWDVIILDKKARTIRLIQAKPRNFSELNTKRLYDAHGDLDGTYTVKFEVI